MKRFERLKEALESSILNLATSYPSEPGSSDTRDTFVPDSGYSLKDDEYLTAASTSLHPLLAGRAPGFSGSKVGVAGAAFYEYASPQVESVSGNLPPGLHLIVSGRMRLFAIANEGTPDEYSEEVCQYRPGQWLGFPQLLRKSGLVRAEWPTFNEVTLKAVASSSGEFRTKWIPEDKALEALKALDGDSLFGFFVRQQVLIRFARREEILNRFLANPVLKLLESEDREYLMQLGVLRRVKGSDSVEYLPAHRPALRTALVLDGSARAKDPVDHSVIALYEENDLVNIEYMGSAPIELTPTELVDLGLTPQWLKKLEFELKPVGDNLYTERDLDFVWQFKEYERWCNPPYPKPEELKLPPLRLRVPERRSSVHLAPHTEILEFNWYGLRWTLSDFAALWSRVLRVLDPHCSEIITPLPQVICVQGASAKEELHTELLAYGLAAKLASDSGATVQVIDVQGKANLEKWFGSVPLNSFLAVGQSLSRRLLGGNIDNARPISFKALPALGQLPVGTGAVRILCPEDSDNLDLDRLINVARAMPGVSHVVLTSYRNRGSKEDGWVRDVARNLNGSSHEVFYVTNRYDATYDFADDKILPFSLTWVYRMTPKYIERERNWAKDQRLKWMLDNVLFRKGDPPPTTPARRQVRVPDEQWSVQDFVHYFGLGLRAAAQGEAEGGGQELVQFLGGSNQSPWARAFGRMARVAERRTVGVALGGGGAWGFAHVALLRHLAQQDIPIDYVAGSSIGAIIGAVYTEGGLDALEKLVDENAARGWLGAVTKDSLTLAVHLSTLSSFALERYIDTQLRKWTGSYKQPCLTLSEIPFYPVGTDLQEVQSVYNLRTNTGWGVRMSGSFVPLVSSLFVGGHHIVDGAFSDNVPCRILRGAGADFVIASNVVPSKPPPLFKENSLPERLTRPLSGINRLFFGRVSDMMRANFVLGYVAGNDQGALTADYLINPKPTDVQLFEMWKAPEIVRSSGELKDRTREGSLLEHWRELSPVQEWHKTAEEARFRRDPTRWWPLAIFPAPSLKAPTTE